VKAVRHDARAAFNIFYSLARPEGVRLTNMQAQKLVYIAHGFSLAVLDEPLFDDPVQAWQYGPVIPTLYEELRSYRAGEVRRRLLSKTRPIEKERPKWKVIRAVWNSYGRFSGFELSAMTHQQGTPWHQVYRPGKRREIPNSTIKDYYRLFARKLPQVDAEAASRQVASARPDDALAQAESAMYERAELPREEPPRKVAPVDSGLEMRWIAEHGREYAGQWVALDGDRLVGHGRSAREVYEAARDAGVQLPLVVRIEPDDQPPFGGW
jgi:uncharacterized phage-associated protein